MSSPKPVLVAGAGPTGLMAALWLSHLKTPFRIVDKHAFAVDTSRATIVHARTLEYYRMLGLSDRAISEGRIVEYLTLFSNLKEIMNRKFGDIGADTSKFPFVLMYPQDLNEQLMIGELEGRGVKVEREVEVTGLVQREDGVAVSLKSSDGGAEEFDASYVLGCDGGHSTVRAHTNIKNTPGTYSQRFFVADVEAEVSVGLRNVNLCFNAEDFCLLFAMPNGRIRLAGWAPDEVVGETFTFADVEESVKRNTGASISKVHWFSTYNVQHGVAESFRDGRVFICGDAAHVHSPVGGQGMNTGLGDASNIAWKIAAVLAGKASPDILDTYQSERRPFAERLVSTTDRAFTIATDKGLMGKAWRTIVMGNVVPLIGHFGFIDTLMFETVSQVRIDYTQSAMSDRNYVGTLYAGERLPWVKFEDGTDNFESMSALNWQIHVYGGLDDEVKDWGLENNIIVQDFPFSEDMKAKRIPKGALILVRPDGYIGQLFHGSTKDCLRKLQLFIDKWGVETF
ncbi:6-methylpretetramide 4-monooxygenase [Drechslerella dactyloides]|uniref:6-methylpretetramide 4-monooxygenase n=1 Tax=Drechslerella dactyloides TaxID=74499 RepID=A0AAD6NJP4_DREDA|nr:6-methylpretetramide 4-monooxygenase [Drechslerella dactyloides]